MIPIPESRITTPYGARGSMWSGGIHKGVDFYGVQGEKVYSPWSGKVISIGGWGPAFGNRSPVIDFDTLPSGSPGYWGVLAHLETCSVRVGQRVKAGQLIGTVGKRGNATGYHLHFEVQKSSLWTQNGYTNPKPWIDAQPSDEVSPGVLQGGKVYASKMHLGATDSDSVRNLQIMLNEKENTEPILPVTGNYLELTVAKCAAFQRSCGWSGIDADGIAGPETVKRLGLTWVDNTSQN